MTENSYDSDILEETPTIAVDKIKLTTKWVFWHQLQNQSKASDKNDTYFENLKELVEFEDLFTFWQFWNNYPASFNLSKLFYDGESIK